MKNTKLENYLEIIRITILYGSIGSERIERLLGVNKNELNEGLNFLLGEKMLKRLVFKGLATYSATPKGIRIAEYFQSTKKEMI